MQRLRARAAYHKSCVLLTVCRACLGTSLTFNVAETSITFPFHRAQAQQLSSSITELIQTFAAKQKAERPRRWNMMEYKYKSEIDGHDTAVTAEDPCCCHENALPESPHSCHPGSCALLMSTYLRIPATLLYFLTCCDLQAAMVRMIRG